VTSDSSDGRESVRGRPEGAMASAGVLGGPGVRGVSRVASETRDPVESTWPEGMVLELGRVSESESRLGLDLFMVMTDGRVDGDVEMVAIDEVVDEPSGETVFMVIA
jgi:hypothetical protein